MGRGISMSCSAMRLRPDSSRSRLSRPPKLLALPDPYDPASRAHVPFLHDMTLYKGKYYGYWGPFPGVVHALWLVVTGSSLDQDVAQFVVLSIAPIVFWWM